MSSRQARVTSTKLARCVARDKLCKLLEFYGKEKSWRKFCLFLRIVHSTAEEENILNINGLEKESKVKSMT